MLVAAVTIVWIEHRDKQHLIDGTIPDQSSASLADPELTVAVALTL